jgi:hypothetical protein
MEVRVEAIIRRCDAEELAEEKVRKSSRKQVHFTPRR